MNLRGTFDTCSGKFSRLNVALVPQCPAVAVRLCVQTGRIFSTQSALGWSDSSPCRICYGRKQALCSSEAYGHQEWSFRRVFGPATGE